MQTRKAPVKRRPLPVRHEQRSKSPLLPAIVAACTVLALVCGFLLQYKLFPDGVTPASAQRRGAVTEIAATGSVRVNEIMPSNGSAWSDEKGQYGDWVEICNASTSESVDITGWTLTDSTSSLAMFTFPRQVLGPGEYTLVFCDGTLQNTPGYTYHAPFKIASDGDIIMLFNADGNAVQAVNTPSLGRNQSYAYNGSSWEITAAYTPMMPNEESYHRAMLSYLSGGGESPVYVSEIMADNATYIPDEDGWYCDWIELGNRGGSAVDIGGWCLSDDASNPTKWRFPAGTVIQPGEFLVVYASGKDRSVAGQPLHTGFKLNAEGETVVLANEKGIPQSSVPFSNLKADRSLSFYDNGYTVDLAPTPGRANTAQSAAAIAREFTQANTTGVVISEVLSGVSRTVDTEGEGKDWVELHNTSTRTVDLSGWGLSDEADQPRKWQFAEGATILPGQYLIVYAMGEDLQSVSSGKYFASFSISQRADACEEITLCTPDGAVVDRMPLPPQYASVSYGRIDGKDGFFYLAKATEGAQNYSTGYATRVAAVTASLPGGLYDGPVTVELSGAPGATVRYTTDGSEPTQDSPVYEGPLTFDSTTVLRARAWRGDELRSTVTTHTYFVGVSHTMDVISLVLDPADLWSNDRGLYIMGPHALNESPYGSIGHGANFWMTWEKAANIEYFTTDGECLFDQGCGFTLHGQYSRSEVQKAFRIIARTEYGGSQGGTNRFAAPLFSRRDYTEYQSFVLRSSGSDGDKTRMRDSILTSLAENTNVMYQETELVVVYLNGEFWGHYNLRERINKYSIAQFEGWTDVEHIDIVKANTNVLQGSDETYATMLAWVKKNGVKNDDALALVGNVIDIDNYIDYMCLEIFTGNTDTLNVKRYRSQTEGDGKWRWIYFDLDWAFYTNTNSIARWITPGGMGNGNRTDNTLFVALMNNSTFRDRFLTRMGELMATDLTTRNIVDKMNDRIQELMPVMEKHISTWKDRVETWKASGSKILGTTALTSYKFSISQWKSEISSMISYAETRPGRLLEWTQKALKLSDSQMQHYFAGAYAAIDAYKASK